MPRNKLNSHHRIALNGHFLDSTLTLVGPSGAGGVEYRGCPLESCQAIESEEGLTVHLPALAALQLYYDGVLTADRERPVEITVAGKRKGVFYLRALRRRREEGFAEPVALEFSRTPEKTA